MSENKSFTNKQLKLIILDLYKSYNIELDENLKIKLQQSSKTQYKYQIKIYEDIKQYIENNISKSTNDTEKDDIELNKKENECQTNINIDNDGIYNELITELKTEIYYRIINLRLKTIKKLLKNLIIIRKQIIQHHHHLLQMKKKTMMQ